MRFLLLLSTSLAARLLFPQYILMSKQFYCLKDSFCSAPQRVRLSLKCLSPPTQFYLPFTDGTFVFTFPSFIFLPIVLLTTFRYHTNHQQFRNHKLRNIILEATAISEKCLEGRIWEKLLFPRGDKANNQNSFS